MSRRVQRQRPSTTSVLQPEVEPIRTGPQEPEPDPPQEQPQPRESDEAEQSWVQLGTYVPADVQRALRVHCAVTGMEQREVVTQALREWLPRQAG